MKFILTTVLAGIAFMQPEGFAATERENSTRLVSTDAVVTEVLTLLQADDQLVAVDASSELPAGRELARLGYHRALAAEGLLALEPDLVIGAETMGPPHVIDALARADIPLLRLPTASTLDMLRTNILTVAQAVQRQEQAAVLLQQLNHSAVAIRQSPYADLSAAFLLRGEGGKLRLAGTDTAGAGFLALLGTHNVADYRGYRSVTAEGLLELAPAILVLADTQGQDTKDLISRYPMLRFSEAVKQERLFSVDPSTLVSGISPSAIEEASRIIDAGMLAKLWSPSP